MGHGIVRGGGDGKVGMRTIFVLPQTHLPPRSRVLGWLTSVFERSAARFGSGGGGILGRGSRLEGW